MSKIKVCHRRDDLAAATVLSDSLCKVVAVQVIVIVQLVQHIVAVLQAADVHFDLEDFLDDESSSENENGMGSDIIYSFDSGESYECPQCGHIIQINGWIREYPIGAYDSDSINITDCEDTQNDK